jgi:rhamnose utilization protein RhaD (predicted bifunctional aldolase and dehydrogenase)
VRSKYLRRKSIRMEINSIEEYIEISVLLGSYHELVQGSGGNISVKQGDTLCVKSSGRILSETRYDYGYTLCSISALASSPSSEIPTTAVIGGEPSSRPSMEVWFHLLPKTWIVHLHPTFLLAKLCGPKWLDISTEFSHIHVPYHTPGKALADAIFSKYSGQSVVFLQNHGIIVCADTSDEVLSILDTLWTEHSAPTNRPLSLRVIRALQDRFRKHSEQPYILKPCAHIALCNERYFLPITPDISLFLKQYPLVQETKDEVCEELLAKYISKLDALPAVLRIQGRIFVAGNSIRHCICIEEILESYLEIIHLTNPNELTLFSESEQETLKASPQEKHRLQIL